jgi:hypothetical protein
MIFSIDSYKLLINYALQYGCNILSKLTRQKKNYENSNISPCKNIIIFKKSSERNQNPSRYYNSITNLKFQHKPKYHLSKNPHIKIHLLPRGKNP